MSGLVDCINDLTEYATNVEVSWSSMLFL